MVPQDLLRRGKNLSNALILIERRKSTPILHMFCGMLTLIDNLDRLTKENVYLQEQLLLHQKHKAWTAEVHEVMYRCYIGLQDILRQCKEMEMNVQRQWIASRLDYSSETWI
jgi:hypothetical protein